MRNFLASVKDEIMKGTLREVVFAVKDIKDVEIINEEVKKDKIGILSVSRKNKEYNVKIKK